MSRAALIVRETHREIHATLTDQDREWLARRLCPRGDFPPERISAWTIAALPPLVLRELERRIGIRTGEAAR